MALAAVVLGVFTALTKLAAGWQAAKTLGVGIRGRMRAGTVLIARGEFSIVIAALGVSAPVDSEVGALFVTVNDRVATLDHVPQPDEIV
ncbi:hypothetical protein LCGC14_1613670, partial [marine sediment metagenome]